MKKQMTPLQKLQDIFGYTSFRGSQEAIINNLLQDKNTLVIMPTGGGKSMCYQIPALLKDGLALVISPLIALMKNQVDFLQQHNVPAAMLNSTLSKKKANQIKEDLLAGKLKLLYVAPESLNKEANLELFKRANLSFIAIDEAHCISDWGHDFRPEYRKISNAISELGSHTPIIAVTATATPKVQCDILKNLHMENAKVFQDSFARKNLFYKVVGKTNVHTSLVHFVNQHPHQSGVIYCQSRKKVTEIASLLSLNGVKAAPYHAGLDAKTRAQNQEEFLSGEIHVIVATIAFGMGIDKPNIRFVIHYDVPKSLESYYQETGRAGRDGQNATCLLFYSAKDIARLAKFSKDKPVTEKANTHYLLNAMAAFATTGSCRRQQILYYFGESYKPPCNHCDNCQKPTETFEGQASVLTALQAVKAVGEQFNTQHIVNFLQGISTPYMESHEHYKLPLFGQGRDESKAYWKTVIRQACLNGLLYTKEENKIADVLLLTQQGKKYLTHPHPVTLYKDREFTSEDSLIPLPKKKSTQPVDKKLLALLDKQRQKIAAANNLKQYHIFRDEALNHMASTYPVTITQLSHIPGIGPDKAKRFGPPMLEIINDYVKANEISPDAQIIIRSNPTKNKTKAKIIRQIDRKVDLEEIAEANGQSLLELLKDIQQLCRSGVKLNINYYIDIMLTPEAQDDIFAYFQEAPTDDMEAAQEELGDEYEEDEIRLMHIKFLSEATC